jgi:hypothetical protein
MNTMKQFRSQALKLLVVMLTTIAAVASVVIFYDPATGRVLGMTNQLGISSVVVTNSLPPGYPTEWIFTNDMVRLMTAEEMVARDLYMDFTNHLRLQVEAKFRLTNDIAVIAAVNVLLDLVNTNRLREGMQAITDEEFIGLVHEEIDAR